MSNTSSILNPLIKELVDRLNVPFTKLSGYDIFVLDFGRGMIGRCSTPTTDKKILVMLCGSEWVIDNINDVVRTVEDITTFVGNR